MNNSEINSEYSSDFEEFSESSFEIEKNEESKITDLETKKNFDNIFIKNKDEFEENKIKLIENRFDNDYNYEDESTKEKSYKETSEMNSFSNISFISKFSKSIYSNKK